jgi:hypothetical protein
VLCLVLLLQSLAIGYRVADLAEFEANFSVKIIVIQVLHLQGGARVLILCLILGLIYRCILCCSLL